MEVPQKTEDSTIVQFINSTSGYLSEENENTNSKRHMCTLMSTVALFIIGKMWKPSNCQSVDEQIKKMCFIYIYIYICVYIYIMGNITQP